MENSRSVPGHVSPPPVRLTSIGLAWLVITTGCGTDAVGTPECRAFERVRCEAAVACGYPDVEECVRFERDHCLHGVALDSISVVELDGCVQDVARAGRCAAGQGPDTLAASCSDRVQVAPAATTACDVVRSPERAVSCAFLAPGAPAAPAPVAPVDADGGA